jgi:hypothetical protein
MTLQIIWNAGTLYQLSTFEHPDWNVGIVSEAISLVDFFQKLVNNMRMVKSALGYDIHTAAGLDFWSQSVKSLSMVMSTFEGKAGDPEHEGGNPGAHDQPGVETPNYSNFPPGVEFMDFLDDVWLQSSDSYQKW